MKNPTCCNLWDFYHTLFPSSNCAFMLPNKMACGKDEMLMRKRKGNYSTVQLLSEIDDVLDIGDVY